MSDFYEVVDLTANIESILKRYPFSIGIFRELLQNSDDAGAKRQVFILDYRVHSTLSLVDEKLAVLQGPALLAFNDATFADDDWQALQNISRSSKKTNTAKIGKYGIGMRSGYHLTDNIEVLSGDSLVIFDPHRTIIPEGGKRWHVNDLVERHRDQLSPFWAAFADEYTTSFPGTVIRLPLRSNSRSLLSTKVSRPEEIVTLLEQFVREELDIVMLFLSHIEEIEVRVIDDNGERVIGRGHIERNAPAVTSSYSPKEATSVHSSLSTIKIEQYATDGTSVQRSDSTSWYLLHSVFRQEECVTALQDRLGSGDSYDVLADVQSEKLCPSNGSPIAIAVPLSPKLASTNFGKLFTYLPLPLKTGFPCHIHSLFALTDSRDHLKNSGEIFLNKTRDKLLTEWNYVLFEKFIPRTWAALLCELSATWTPIGLFDVWPPQQHPGTSGESVYWQNMTESLLHIIVEKKLPIWPLVSRSDAKMPSGYSTLSEVLVAPPTSDPALLESLSCSGMKICQPPAYIHDILVAMSQNRVSAVTFLTPANVHLTMSRHVSECRGVTRSSDRQTILSYLISSNDLRLITEIPFMPTVSCEQVSFSVARPQVMLTYTLFNGEEEALFGHYDRTAIALRHLPESIVRPLLTLGEATLNIRLLDCSRVHTYLRQHIGDALEDSTFPLKNDTIPWVLQFWKWLPTWSQARQFLAERKALALLPTTNGTLRSIRDGVFRSRSVDSILQEALSQLGLAFVDKSFPMYALSMLEDCGFIKDGNSALDLLDHLSVDSLRMDMSALRRIQSHLSSCLGRTGRLTDERKLRLRALPIHCLLSSRLSTFGYSLQSQMTSIPARAAIHCVSSTSPALFPVIPDVVFISWDDPGRVLVEYIDLYAATPQLKDNDMISLMIDRFESQQPNLQLAFLEHIASRREPLAGKDRKKLQWIPFVTVGTGNQRRSPKDIVDPDSDIARLVIPEDMRTPSSLHDGLYLRMLTPLRHLGLLRRQLDSEFVQDRMRFIAEFATRSERRASEIARYLLDTMQETFFDCSHLHVDPNLPWLPTSAGFRSPNCCRDDVDSQLFDRVLPVLKVRVPSSLRRAFAWNAPIPIDVLKKQFEAVVAKADNAQYLHSILLEFGRRITELKDHLSDLRKIVDEKAWIPISWDSPFCVASTPQAVYHLDNNLPGFYRIPSDLRSRPGIKPFLDQMGCSERPSTTAILARIETFARDQPLSPTGLRGVVKLLEAIDLNVSDNTSWLIPDVNGYLRHSDALFYDDHSLRSINVELPEGQYKLHHQVPYDLAIRMGVRSLRSLELRMLDLDSDDEDMREDLTTRISNVLRAYDISQSFNEFLANAADAGARSFDVMLNERRPEVSTLEFLSPQLKQCFSGPALLVYNDALFEEKDFKGIREFGLGGKQETPNVIGKFGLGALTMFHFTEVPMIVSGKYIQFLDPSKTYLPPHGDRPRSGLRMTIDNLNSLYNGHVVPLKGLFGFSAEKGSFEGTLFWLPLRSASQARHSRLLKSALSLDTLRKMLHSYRSIAARSLLFINIERIGIWHGGVFGECELSWQVSATRKELHTEDTYTCHQVEIASRDDLAREESHDWIVVKRKSTLDHIHADLRHLINRHRLKSLDVGLAGLLNQTELTRNSGHRIFSYLPLPIKTTLPVDIHGSFILADDRRSIRFDDDGRTIPEAVFNRWILTDMIVPLYFYFLERWPLQESNIHLWPSAASKQAAEDFTSLTVSNSFYQTLASSQRKVCHTVGHHRIRAQDTVFLDSVPRSIKQISFLLDSDKLLEIPPKIAMKAHVTDLELKWVNPEFLLRLLRGHCSKVVSLYADGTIDRDDVEACIRYLLEIDPQPLEGLPLLPRADLHLAYIQSSAGSTVYSGSWPGDATPWPLFPPDRFLDPELKCSELLLQRDWNVSELKGAGLVELIRSRLPKSTNAEVYADQSERQWIAEFWEFLSQPLMTSISVDEFASLALVPTAREDHYVSLDHCRTEAVLVLPKDHDPQHLCGLLDKLDATVVMIKTLPNAALRKAVKCIPFSFIEVLKFLLWKYTDLASLSQSFERLSEQEQIDFAQWARKEVGYNIYSLQTSDHKRAACHLPIWPAQRANLSTLRSLSDRNVKILPAHVQILDAAPFLSPTFHYVEIPDDIVACLSVSQLSLVDFFTVHVNYAQTLAIRDIPSYQKLLDNVLTFYKQKLKGCCLRVPNHNRCWVEPSTLYAGSIPIFRDIFSIRPQHLIYPEFARYESLLQFLGLKHEKDFAAFLECVNVVHADRPGPEKLRRASALFAWYQELPMQIGKNVSRWRQVMGYRFIPRNPVRRTYERNASINCDSYAVWLPDVVSPNEILRADFEAVGWTQRACFLTSPDDRLLLADQSLGVPSVAEVVEHLRILALKVAADHDGHTGLLEDLRLTYEWLNEHSIEAGQYLLDYRDDHLFLNINEAGDPWHFVCASQLVFNAPDEDDRKSVREFLVPFKELLLAANAHEIKQPAALVVERTPVEEVFFRFREAINEQRRLEQLTDAVLLSADGQEFHVHRSFLAGSTEYFHDLFCGSGLRETTSAASPRDPIRIPLEESGIAVGCALEHIYTGEVTTIDPYDQDQLLSVLRLAHYWRLEGLHREMQGLLIKTLTPGTYKHLHKEAQVVHANALVEKCNEYSLWNWSVFRQFGLESPI